MKIEQSDIRIIAAVLFLFVGSLSGLSAQMGPQAGMKNHGGPSASMPMGQQMNNDFPPLWKEALGKLSLTSAQKQKAASLLKDARTKLSENWTAFQDAMKREMAAKGDAKRTAQRRVDLAHSERDLVVSGVETELKGFLSADQVDVIMTAAFHGVSKAHSGDMPMGQDDGHGGMSVLQDYSMRLMDMAGMMNADYQAVTIDQVIRELETK